MGRVVAIASQKGGVAKTTTAVNLGAALAGSGRQVLLVDLDPQANATSGLGHARVSADRSIYAALSGNASIEEIQVATTAENLALAPSNIDLAGAEVEMVNAPDREGRLRDVLASTRERYDFVLIDCGPSLGLLTINALVCSGSVLIPVQCEYYALEGLSRLLDSVALVQGSLNPQLRIGGLLLTLHDGRTRLSGDVVAAVRERFGELVFTTVIPRSVRLAEAPSYAEPIEVYDRMSRGAIAYRALAAEVIARWNRQDKEEHE